MSEEKIAEPAKAPLPIIVTSFVENQDDRSSSQEPTAEFTISLGDKNKVRKLHSYQFTNLSAEKLTELTHTAVIIQNIFT